MDMCISGSGKIPAGEYENILTRGNCRLFGRVICESFSASGTSRGEDIECRETFKASGSTSFSGNIKAKNIHTSGSLSCGGDFVSDGSISLSGSVICGGSISGGSLTLAGSITAGNNVEAESIVIEGKADCRGILNAQRIKIKVDRKTTVGSIGGGSITVKRKRFSVFTNRKLNVISTIEGDIVEIEHTVCPRVMGRTVSIGKGCKIDLVQYSEKIQISKGAKVARVEKI